MKNTITLNILLILSLSTFAKTYSTYTAKVSGNWDNLTTWNITTRTDGVQKDKIIIPTALTVTADNAVNNMGYVDIEMLISGTLKLASSTILYFGSNSKIDILSTGVIDGDGASQQIFIGSVLKYEGNKNKALKGPLYADYSTGIAPNGFSAYVLLAVNASVTPSIQVATKSTIYSSNKNINITFNSEVRNSVAVKILNMNGTVVASQFFSRPSSKLTMNMNQLPTGIYVVYVTDNSKITTVVKVSIN